MLTTRIFRPTMTAGLVYARAVGALVAMQSIGGIEELKLAIEEDKITQSNFSTPGGGNRAQVSRVKSVKLTSKLQDLNPVNLARAVFGSASEVAGATVTNEAHTAYEGGLIRLNHLNPSTVVLKKATVAIAAAGNYEVRPEGVFILDGATDLANGDAVTVDYAHSGYDLIQALTGSAPILEMSFAGVNEANDSAPSVVDFFRVQLSPTKGLNYIASGFITLDVEGEVLLDSTKTGVGISKYFRKQIFAPA